MGRPCAHFECRRQRKVICSSPVRMVAVDAAVDVRRKVVCSMVVECVCNILLWLVVC